MAISKVSGPGRHSALLTFAIGIVLALSGGCGDSCTIGAIECHGNELWQCVQIDSDRSGTKWDRSNCDVHRYCRVGTTPAGVLAGQMLGVCAAEPDPEPSCLTPTIGQRNTMSACTSDGRAVTCMAGYVDEVLATCASPALCIVAATPTACAASKVPDLRCPAGPTTHITACQGDHAVTCAAGYLLSDQDCGPGLCYTRNGTQPTCVTSTTPDPRCTALSPGGTAAGTTSGCTGNGLFTCVDNLYTRAKDCGIDYCADLGGGSSFCGQTRP